VSLTPSEFERHYLASAEPTAQSGCNTGLEGWEIGRRPIATAIHRPGTFLDIGCANGLLMESIVRWAAHPLEPYGLDFARGLVELARSRLPESADRIYLGDVREWESPHRFDFIRTELVYVEGDLRHDLVKRLLLWLQPGGRLIVCGYGEPVCVEVRGWGIEPELELAWRSASGGVNELTAIGVGRGNEKG
jgi:SAM-dependent methyltransferase